MLRALQSCNLRVMEKLNNFELRWFSRKPLSPSLPQFCRPTVTINDPEFEKKKCSELILITLHIVQYGFYHRSVVGWFIYDEDGQ